MNELQHEYNTRGGKHNLRLNPNPSYSTSIDIEYMQNTNSTLQ